MRGALLSNSNQPSSPPEEAKHRGILGWVVRTILGGIALVLPFAVLLAIVHYIFSLMNDYVVTPLAKLLLPKGFEDLFIYYWGPLVSIVAGLVFLFFMGLLFRTRVRNFLDWAFGKVPGVNTIYSAISDTAQALTGPPGLANVDTVVLVPFPQNEMRMAGYLMTKSEQPNGRTLVAVYIPLVLFPPSGYTVIVPEDKIVYTDWPTKDVWKLLLSGGLTIPKNIPFEPEEGTNKNQTTSGEPAVDHNE